MIDAVRLHKEYDGNTAVESSTFRIQTGEIFGLIGPNGAGKTTTLKILAGLLEPSSGHARVAGYDSTDREMRQYIGFLPEESPVYEDMSPRSYLRFFADLYGVDNSTAHDRIESMLDRLGLSVRDRALGNLSKGMRRKVAIARSLVNDPRVLIYDEPASGLDPLTTNTIIEFIHELREGRTIVFSAHNLYHVEALCDRVGIMVDGALVTLGTIEEIRDTYGGVEYHVYTDVPLNGAERVERGFRSIVHDLPGVNSIKDTVATNGGTVLDVRTREPSLEEIFLAVAGDAS